MTGPLIALPYSDTVSVPPPDVLEIASLRVHP